MAFLHRVYMRQIRLRIDHWNAMGNHKIEYDIEKSTTGVATNNLTSTKSSRGILPIDADVVYGVAHQHSGGIGSTIYEEPRKLFDFVLFKDKLT
ncbi:putative stress up-regulated Nod 19 [Helianthus annuus]|uniref:Stress up-regulated Nod 19 n=1 Tax=Helianthus annuus TaxID=4232 RepID=A0A9K3H6Q1_HELAN|nr:putative stress up-regulated Nod 19 [Helianthus annuus]KAJ0655553.1 putative stress up-regulated Nod 19 [Helianthus annuus]KAJ0659237.1 putative stress up-regulated Nod 19 [Helianthus annuus]KAJ0839508.1 putative stress up-regulated Nod 19 [Helianthus annuus]KAJ0852869.1 putative stress up-regulated Nod 19 [Helianthus annuus]